MFGINKNTVSNWWKNYETSGNSGYKSKKKGVKSEDKKLLKIHQEKAIQLMIIDKMPEQLKLDYGLWIRKAVKELVEREFGIVIAINTMGDYLRSWGFTPQKRIKNNCCGLSKYIGQSEQEKFYIFHTSELCSKGFNFGIK